MVELFQLILKYPIAFLVGLCISSGTIYSVFAVIKGVIKFFTKKKIEAKERANNEKIANLVISKLGGPDNFIDRIVLLLIKAINPAFNEIKEILTGIKEEEKCPVELKAYIQTVLSYGNKELLLAYQQLKNQLISESIKSTNEIIDKCKQKVKQEQEKQEEAIQEPSTEIEDKSEGTNSKVEEDVSYG